MRAVTRAPHAKRTVNHSPLRVISQTARMGVVDLPPKGHSMIGFLMKRQVSGSGSGTGPRRSILRDRRGGVIVEFAAVAAPFFALIIANLVTALAMFSQQVLDTTTEKMSRRLMTGQEQQAGTTKAAFKTAVCSDLPTLMICDRVMVNVTKVTD